MLSNTLNLAFKSMKLGAESNKIILNVSVMDVVVLLVTKYAFAVSF